MTKVADNTQKKKRGRPPLKPGEKGRYQYSRVQKKKVSERQKIAAQKQSLERAEKRLEKLNKKSEALRTSDRIAGKGGVLDETTISQLPAQVREQLQEDTELIFSPNEGPQTDFLASPEKEVLYGGAAGGGKSYLGCCFIIYLCTEYDGVRCLIGRSKLDTLKKTTIL